MAAAFVETGVSRLDGLEKLSIAVSRRIALLAVAGMLLLSLLTIIDITLRYLWSSPIQGLDEATQLIMAVVITASFPIGIATRNHVTIDFFRASFGRRTEALVEAVGGALVLALLALLAWRFGLFAERVTLRHDATMIVGIPVAPFWWLVTALLALCVFIQGVLFLNQGRRAFEVWGGGRVERAGVGGMIASIGLVAALALYVFMARWGASISPTALAGIAFVALWVPILVMIPVGVAMVLTGLIGGSVLSNFDAAASTLVIHSASFLTNLNLVVLPLFLMKGGFATAAGLSGDAYRLAHALFGNFRGGLAIATIGSCAGFGAVTGSSLATAATIGSIALPEMKKRGYSTELATGCVAAGGTLGSLIPPSGIMVIYAVLTESSVGKIFVAAILPAVLATLLYMVTIAVEVMLWPQLAGPRHRAPRGEIMRATLNSWGVVALFGSVIGGIYAGIFTATEAGAVGAGGGFLFALARGRLTGAAFWQVLGDVARNTALIYMLLFGAVIFSFFIGLTQMPVTAVELIRVLDPPPLVVVAILLAIYIVLGFFMDPITTLFITVPVVAPLVFSLGYDPIWWGVVTIVVVEIGLIHPPFGLNAFIIKGVAGEAVPLGTVFRGIVPFLIADFVKLAILTLFPIISLWLPSTMN